MFYEKYGFTLGFVEAFVTLLVDVNTLEEADAIIPGSIYERTIREQFHVGWYEMYADIVECSVETYA